MSRLSLISFNTLSINLKGGTATKSGDGITTVFTIPHEAVNMPVGAFVEAQSDDARGVVSTTWDVSNITVTYAIAPPQGTDNLVFSWVVV